MAELLLGCGHRHEKQFGISGRESWNGLVRLDMNPDTGCDVVHDLDVLPYPFEDGQFDEIHAYEVLEHCGRQGDWRFFFAQFDELSRILKPGGYIFASTPAWDSPWAWGDPGHTRVIDIQQLGFLDRRIYESCKETPTTDYRSAYKSDFELAAYHRAGDVVRWVLRKK